MKYRVGDLVKTKSIYENLDDSVCRILEIRKYTHKNFKFPYIVQFLNEPYKKIRKYDIRAMFNEEEIIGKLTEEEALAWLI